MQKIELINVNIKTICSSVAKKLLVLGLVTAGIGTYIDYGGSKFTTSAQTPKERASENQHIEVEPNMQVNSFSGVELTCEREESARIVSSSAIDNRERPANVTNSDSSRRTLRAPNGVRFAIGSTLQETQENLLRAMPIPRFLAPMVLMTVLAVPEVSGPA